MNLRQRLQIGTDRVLSGLLVLEITGSILAFGGRVWWGPPALAGLTLALGLATILRACLEGRFALLKSPLTILGMLALGLAVVQLAPLPATMAARISPGSHAAYTVGMLPERAQLLDPSVELPEPAPVRSPVSVDRAATLRWAALATACLALFWGSSRFADRLGHLYLIWGSLVAGFFLNSALAAVQLACGSSGLYGFIDPGRGSKFASTLLDPVAPNLIDVLQGPGSSVLRVSAEPAAGHLALAMAVPERSFLIGSQMGGPGAYLALASIALPLALALTLQLMAPRGSRESLASRLASSGQSSLVGLLTVMLVASAIVVGLLAGPLFSLPFAFALILAGLPAAWPSGLRWSAFGLVFLCLSSLGAGAALGELWASSTTYPAPVAPLDAEAPMRVWTDSLPILHDFPVIGTGLGTFSTVYPYYKTGDASVTTASSSLLQWWVETGISGMVLLALGGLWVIWRLPGAVQRVGTADRMLAFGLIGAAAGFTLYSVVNWTVELASVALAASAVAGTFNRWLAGGTDLFVERG